MREPLATGAVVGVQPDGVMDAEARMIPAEHLRDERLVDRAALQQQVEDLLSSCPWDCGDGDGIVGIVDFLALLAEWDQVGTPCDFDGGGVGIVDFLALLANWGACQ